MRQFRESTASPPRSKQVLMWCGWGRGCPPLGGARPRARICVRFWIGSERHSCLWWGVGTQVWDTLGVHWGRDRGGRFLCRVEWELWPSRGARGCGEMVGCGQTVLKASSGWGAALTRRAVVRACVRGPGGIRLVGTRRCTKRDCPDCPIANGSRTKCVSAGGDSGVTAPGTSHGAEPPQSTGRGLWVG